MIQGKVAVYKLQMVVVLQVKEQRSELYEISLANNDPLMLSMVCQLVRRNSGRKNPLTTINQNNILF
jgi:DNA-binding protein Fis